MINTLLKPALRHLRKYPVFSLINLGGLSVGIAASFILLLYAEREISTDSGFHDADKIARIGTDFFNMGGFAASQPMLRDLLQMTCKDVDAATHFDKAYEEIHRLAEHRRTLEASLRHGQPIRADCARCQR